MAGEAWRRRDGVPLKAGVQLAAQALRNFDEQIARFDIQGTRRHGAGANWNRSFDRDVAPIQLSPQPARLEHAGRERQRPREARERQLPIRLDDVHVVQVDFRGRVTRSGRTRNTNLERGLAADSRGDHPEDCQRRRPFSAKLPFGPRQKPDRARGGQERARSLPVRRRNVQKPPFESQPGWRLLGQAEIVDRDFGSLDSQGARDIVESQRGRVRVKRDRGGARHVRVLEAECAKRRRERGIRSRRHRGFNRRVASSSGSVISDPGRDNPGERHLPRGAERRLENDAVGRREFNDLLPDARLQADPARQLAVIFHQPVDRRVRVAADGESIRMRIQRDLRPNRSFHTPRRGQRAWWQGGNRILDAPFERDEDAVLALADTREPQRESPDRHPEWFLHDRPAALEPDSPRLNEAQRPAPELSLDLRNGDDCGRFEQPIEAPGDAGRRGQRRQGIGLPHRRPEQRSERRELTLAKVSAGVERPPRLETNAAAGVGAQGR